ncbi:MAG TPA: two-component regulator propeller domain-containing protein, partial [Candidatus Polarisedimenticolaceae bacterium]|nr:two-component regulator propeller domain-containing protein [Candidatus Polarisedimenticolaceae bacterium]
MTTVRSILLGAAGALLGFRPVAAAALPEQLVVEQFGSERGLPSETITALYRDRAGFLWVGSREGLSVWDGYSVRIYEHEVGDPGSLPDNSIRTIFEDRSGRLWVGTASGGLARLDRATGHFEIFRHDPANPASLSNDNVYAIAEDPGGALWIGTQEGLHRFDPATRTFEKVSGVSSAYALKLDRAGRLWIATVGAGVVSVDPKTRRATPVTLIEADPTVFAIAEDLSGTLWFGTERALYRFDRETSSLRRAAVPELAPGKDVPIVTSLSVDARGILWMSTWNRGLVAFDPATGGSRGYRHDPQREGSLAADRLACVVV